MKTRKAYEAFLSGNFNLAREIYLELATELGEKYFSLNIEICEKNIIKNDSHEGWGYPKEINVDNFLEFAKSLIKDKDEGVKAKGSNALFIFENLSFSDVNYFKYEELFKKIKSHGVNIFGINMPVKQNDDITLIDKRVPANGIDIYSDLNKRIDFFLKLYEDYNPAVVIGCSDFLLSLPALVAAKIKNISFVKENLYFNDYFEIEKKNKFDFLSFYKLESFCLDNSDYDYFFPIECKSYTVEVEKKICQLLGRVDDKEGVEAIKFKKSKVLPSISVSSGINFIEFDIHLSDGGDPKGIVVSIETYDEDGNEINECLEDFKSSKKYKNYQYVSTSNCQGDFFHKKVVLLNLPQKVKKISVEIVSFVAKSDIYIANPLVKKLTVQDVIRWFNNGEISLELMKKIEKYLYSEGALSLRLAILRKKYSISKHKNDFNQFYSAIKELVELDKTWIPEILAQGKKINFNKKNGLKVLHLQKTAYPYENSGGAVRCLNTLISQKRVGIEPFVVTPIGYPACDGFEGGDDYEVVEGIEHFRIGGGLNGIKALHLSERDLYSAFYISKLIKNRGADVIHVASGVRGYELALQALAVKKITGIPVLYEVRSFHEHTWTSVRDDILDLEKTKLRINKENFCMLEADFVTTISFSMKKILVERGVPEEKIAVIPNAIDEEKYLGKTFEKASGLKLKNAEYIVGYISNMSKREGHEYLIKAIAFLINSKKMNVAGLFVGDGPERANLEKLAKNLGVEKNIQFVGEVDHSMINSYYKAIDIFVVPRIPDYAADWVTPLKPYEAMALECPLIVTDLPALKEIVGEHEERGWLAKPADLDSLIDKILFCIENKELVNKKTLLAKEWVFAERTWKANAKRYQEIYKKMLCNN